MSKELKKLTGQRKGYQLNAQRHLTTIDQLCAVELSDANAKQLRLAVKSLQDYQAKIEQFNSQIIDVIDDDDQMEKEAIESARYYERLLQAIQLAEDHLIVVPMSPKHGTADDDDTRSVQSSTTSKSQVKLPKLEIAPFNGDPIRWQEFWDTFESTIHCRSEMDDVEKLKYLKSYLIDDAVSTIDGFRTTAANYQVVVDTLKERYGNPEIAIHAHMEMLLALQPGEMSKLQQIYDECERHIRSLVALGLTEETFGKVFTPIILSKLPRGIRVQLCRSNGTKPWELSRLRELLREEIQAREMSDRYTDSSKSTSNNQNNGNSQKKKPKSLPPTQATFVHQAAESKPNVVCSYCGKNHYSDNCDVYTTVEQRKAQLDGKCLKCLSADHRVRDCKRTKGCFHCKKDNHHSSLCFKKFGGESKGKNQGKSPTPNKGNKKTHKASDSVDPAMLQSGQQVQMQMATVHFPASNVSARIFFDSGSSRSYMTDRLANALGIKSTGQETITSTKFGDRRRKTENFKRSTISIPTLQGDSVDVSVLVTPHICCPIQKYPISLEEHPVLHQLQLADNLVNAVENVDIDVLVGQDYYYNFVGSETLALRNGMFLVNSKLGYMITGRIPQPDSDSDSETSSVMMLHLSSSDEVQLERYWSLEEIGVKDSPYDKDDEVALKQFNDTIHFCNREQRYEVKWPWKPSRPELPTNYGLAVGCLKSLMSRIGDKEELVSMYDATIKDQIEKQVVESVDPEPTNNVVHYIPHHPVVKMDKSTTKLRVVYNASAKCGKNLPSLNDCLLRGPVFLADLCGMLIRFRLHAIAISCDIEKAFLQVQLQESERDCVRFLWLNDPTKPVTKENLLILRFRRVPFGVLSSPFLLQGTVRFHLQQQQSPVAADVDKNIYMDNVASGTQTVDAGLIYYRESKKMFSDISMNLREWYSNSEELTKQIALPDRGKDNPPKVLGLTWKTDADTLSCVSFKACSDVAAITKRKLLQSISTLYDPCGFFTPVTVRGKIIVQELWMAKVPWDETLSSSYASRVAELSADLSTISSVQIPRMFNDVVGDGSGFNELHCFCDASKKAYSAVVYLRTQKRPSAHVALVMSKARLAPIKPVSLPRLELMAVVIGVRTVAYVNREIGIKIDRVIMWSDSKCVLHWIQSNKVLTTFVKNRVVEIQKHPFEFRYIQTTLNPADLPTRGFGLADLVDCDLWWHGPKFLLLDNSKWPENEFETPDTAKLEEKTVVALAAVATSQTGIGSVISIEKFSSLLRLLKVTGWVRRFLHNCRNSDKQSDTTLSTSELTDAKQKWIKFIQCSNFDENGQLHKQLKRFGLYTDNSGVVRCRGRLENSSLPQNEIEPIWLPKNNHFTRLMIMDCHERLYHAPIRHTLAQIRMEFWLPQGPSQVRKVVRKCSFCRKMDGGPFKVPESPPLPSFRVRRSEPFTAVGIDYLGPLLIRSFEDPGTTSKVWICLFTCAATRALHLEVVTSCNTDDFILCLRRFTALYGSPNLIISDNAKHFKLGSVVVKTIFQSSVVKHYSARNGIEWKFIPALAPWMGGFYERLVGSVKRSLRKALQKNCLTLVQLQTVVAEVAAIVNSRPLVPVDLESGELALTPAHFLAKSGRVGLPPSSIDQSPQFDQSDRQSSLLDSWVKGQKLLNQFWNSWHKEYLASLRDRPNVDLNRRNASTSIIKPGVVVLIQEPQPRACWRMAKVIDCHVGNDGQVRSATVQLPNRRRIVRPLKLLHPIEDGHLSSNNITENSDPSSNKVPRKAAIRAKSAILEQLQSDNSSSDSEA